MNKRIVVSIFIIGVWCLIGIIDLSAQKMEGFVLYQMNVYCGDSTRPSKIFTYKNTVGGTPGRPLMGTHSFCVGVCRGRTSRLADELAKLPSHVASDFKWQVEKHEGGAACGKGKSIAECIDTPQPKYSTADGEFPASPWQNGPEVIPRPELCPGCLWELVTADHSYHLRIEDGDNALPPLYNPPKKLFCEHRYLTVWRCPVTQEVTTRLELKTIPGPCGSAVPNW